MTRAESDCTSEHGKNYFDSRLMSDMGMLRQLTILLCAAALGPSPHIEM